MPTAQELIDDVSRIVQDSSYGPDAILGLLNQGMLEIAGWDNTDPRFGLVGSILLPALETQADVVTDPSQSRVELPADYMKNLYAVSFTGQRHPVNILSGMRVFLERWNESLVHVGPVSDATIAGGELHFHPVPAEATTLTLHYYKKPAMLTTTDVAGVTNVPSCLPEALQKPLLVSYAAREILNEIEDGQDGQKVNTVAYNDRFLIALGRLYRSIRHKSPQVMTIRRKTRFF